jgi:sarcosine oxidase/L-pipecolate oxidase
MEPNVLIIGAGTFGTSIAYHLAHSYADPSRVTIVDASPPPSTPAAAIDINRIIRTDYPSPLYMNLAFEAIHDWHWSSHLSHFFHRSGWLMLDAPPATLSSQILQNFTARGSTQTRDIPLDELKTHYPILHSTDTAPFSPNGAAYFNPEAGHCRAALATAYFLSAALKLGVRHLTTRAVSLIHSPSTNTISGVLTSSSSDPLIADKIILATGAWTSALLSPLEDVLAIPAEHRLEAQVTATARVSAYYALEESEAEELRRGKMPVLVYGEVGEVMPPTSSAAHPSFAAGGEDVPLLRYNCSALNLTNSITTPSGAVISMPPLGREQGDVPEKAKREVEEMLVGKVLPEYSWGKEAHHWRMCWDAQTPTEDWLMCGYPDGRVKGLYLAVGGSFHGYK